MSTVLLCVAFALGIALERRRGGGTDDLREQIAAAERERDRLGDELAVRRQASMARHPATLDGPSARQVIAQMERMSRRNGVRR